jgi:hypothetical protein
MDPITALGAASAVIGIAGFAVQLAQVLNTFSGQVSGANESLVAVLTSIESTAESLKLIHKFLETEKANITSGQRTRLFSRDALVFVKNNVDRCLLVFWRIEATVLKSSGGDGPDDRGNLEGALRARLAEFNLQIQTYPDGDALEFIRVRSERVPASVPFFGRLRWPFVARKLDEYRGQLQFHQQCLSLVFMVISLAEVRSKP